MAATDNEQNALAFEYLGRQDVREVTGPNGTLRHIVNKRGVRLAMYCWPVKDAKAVVHLLHGHGSYLGYEYLKIKGLGKPPVYEGSWVQSLNNAGYSVVGIDNQGAGRSSGLRCFCRNFDEYVEDVVMSVKLASQLGIPHLDLSLPRFMMGASMGGCLSVMCAMREPELIKGVALLAPMMSLEKVSKKAQNRILRPVSMLLNATVPAAPLVATAKNHMYEDLQIHYDHDHGCYHGGTRVRNATEYLRVTGWLMRNMHLVNFPFIVFHSENDTMVDCDGSRALYTHSSSEDKTLRLVNHMWHILAKEPGNEKVLAEVTDWFDMHLEKLAPTDSDPDLSGADSDGR